MVHVRRMRQDRLVPTNRLDHGSAYNRRWSHDGIAACATHLLDELPSRQNAIYQIGRARNGGWTVVEHNLMTPNQADFGVTVENLRGSPERARREKIISR